MAETTGIRPGSARARALEQFAVRSRSVTRRAGVDAEAIRVLDALQRAGVDALLLKGPALARTLYRDDEPRGYHDVDLLVAQDDLQVAERAIADLGYTNVSALRGVDDVAGSLNAEAWLPSPEGIGNTAIDLHWRLVGCQAEPELAWDVLRSRRELIEVQGRRVPTLDRAGLALHLALHVAQHGPSDLKAVGDLERGIERWPAETWREAARLAVRLGATEALAAGLRLAPAGASLADEHGLPPADGLLWSIAHGNARPRGTFHLDALARAGSGRERLDVLRRSLLPPPAWIAWEYRWAGEQGPRLLAGYAAHIARAPLWAARAFRFRRRARRAPGR